MATSTKYLETVRKLVHHFNTTSCYSNVLKKSVVVSAVPGHVVGEMKVGEEHLNALGTLHGGLIASLIDNFTIYTMLSEDTDKLPAASINLRVSYINGAKCGDEILITARTIKTGRKISMLECELTEKHSGKLLARGAQTVAMNN